MRFFVKTLIVFFILSTSFCFADEFPAFRFVDGEELTFRVNYSFFNLGTITAQVNHDGEKDGLKTFHIHLTITSNPLLFWVNNQSVYDSYIDENLRPLKFITNEKVDGKPYKAEYLFDYTAKRMERLLLPVDDSDSTKHDFLPIKPNMIDGISLIFYARSEVHQQRKDTVNTFIENNSGDVIFDFMNKEQITDTDELPEGIKTVYFKGLLNIKGIAGVSGPFEAYFSRDASRVPLKSYLEVFIGHVTITLVKWKGWKPLELIE